MRRWLLLFLLPVLGLAGCCNCGSTVNPTNMGPVNPQYYPGVQEPITNDVLYAATAGGGMNGWNTNPNFQPTCAGAISGNTGGTVVLNFGGMSQVYQASSSQESPAPGVDINMQYFDPITVTPGVGGPSGVVATSYFLLFTGFKGPNAATDYCGLDFNLVSGNSTPVDISCYRGFMFFAKGVGHFGVQLVTPLIPSSVSNYYESVFGQQLSPTSWKQFIVNFSDMQQLFGQHVDLIQVLKTTNQLQFQQETPYTNHSQLSQSQFQPGVSSNRNFELDVDYIRFFH